MNGMSFLFCCFPCTIFPAGDVVVDAYFGVAPLLCIPVFMYAPLSKQT